MTITVEQLLAIMPYSKPRSHEYIDFINAGIVEFEIDKPLRSAMFLSELAHESSQLGAMQENLNYSAEGLMKTWPHRFLTLEFANKYARQPEKIANYVYANRCGNGDEASGDGWRHRGAGGIGLTFKNNQAECASYFNIPVESIGDWLRTPEGAMRSAAWFFKKHGCNEVADTGNFDGVCDLINIGRKTEKVGDSIGYLDRLSFYNRAREVLL
jgi:putative chitinase